MEGTGTLGVDTGELRRLDPSQLAIGMTLPGSICSADGSILIRGGRVIEPQHLKLLGKYRWRGIFMTDDWPQAHLDDDGTPGSEPAVCGGPETPYASSTQVFGDRAAISTSESSLVPVAVDTLQPGEVLSCNMYNAEGVLLLAAGLEITPHFLTKLGRHGIFEVNMSESAVGDTVPTQAASPESTAILIPDQSVDSLENVPPTQSQRSGLRPRLVLGQFREELERGRTVYDSSVDLVAEIAVDLYRARGTTVSAVRDVLTRFLDLLCLDSALLPAIVKLKDTSDEYLFQHGLNVALLSMTAAAQLSLQERTILDIGIGALLQDVGMLRLPEELRLAPRSLTEAERGEIQRHPAYALDFMGRMDGIGKISMLVAYQAHERGDRSGYPRGCNLSFIHPFARLVAAADVYAAMCSNRPYRNARSPYEAMEALLRGAGRGQFDGDAVRNFLDSMSLFPIGSYVRLSDGHSAKVLRANTGSHTKPVVLLLNDDGSESDVELDLTGADQVCVVQALRDERDLVLEYWRGGQRPLKSA